MSLRKTGIATLTLLMSIAAPALAHSEDAETICTHAGTVAAKAAAARYDGITHREFRSALDKKLDEALVLLTVKQRNAVRKAYDQVADETFADPDPDYLEDAEPKGKSICISALEGMDFDDERPAKGRRKR